MLKLAYICICHLKKISGVIPQTPINERNGKVEGLYGTGGKRRRNGMEGEEMEGRGEEMKRGGTL